MQVFISWSGEQSKALGACLRDWLPLVIQSVRPWFSPEDIDKGSRWLTDLSNQLESQSVAIVCVTPESASSPWLLFEVGALSRALEQSWVCPVLLGLEPSDLTGPLSQFQATRVTKEDIRRLLGTLSRRLDIPLNDQTLDTLHDLLWPRLADQLALVSALPGTPQVPHRQTPELLGEILDRLRSVERHVADIYANDEAKRRQKEASQKFFEVKQRSDALVKEASDLVKAREEVEKQLGALAEADSMERVALLARRASLGEKGEAIRRGFAVVQTDVSALRELLPK